MACPETSSCWKTLCFAEAVYYGQIDQKSYTLHETGYLLQEAFSYLITVTTANTDATT